MTTNRIIEPAATRKGSASMGVAYPVGSIRFDRLMAGLSLWLIAGLFLDGWAHNSFHDIETFLTPWHAVLYSGLGASAVALGIPWINNVQRGYRWDHALPKEYVISLLGVLIFGVAGGLDFAWHSTFGFEIDTEALLSPPHLLLATGGLFIISGPLRAAWQRLPDKGATGWAKLWPAMVSAFATLSTFTFFTQFSNQFQHANTFVGGGPTEDVYFWQVTTISYILIPTVLYIGFILLLMRRWALPIGSMVLFILGNAMLMFFMGSSYTGEQWPVLLAALLGSVIVDVLYTVLKPSADRVRELRIFAFAAPLVLNLLYLGVLIATGGIWWRIHMWLGAPILSAAIGLGLSYLTVPPTTQWSGGQT